MRITSLTTPLGTDTFGNDVLVFRQLEGHEALNTLFEYTLTMHSTQTNILPKTMLGKTVTVAIEDQFGNPRYLNAVVAGFRNQGGNTRRTVYEAKLAPWFSLAAYSADCKTFQNQSIVDIATEVLGKYSFPVKKKLLNSYDELVFVVQYNESDFSFISRLLERAGIGYYFEHAEDSHTLVLTDEMSVFSPATGHNTIPFRAADSAGVADEEIISQWEPHQSIRSGSFATGDYWYRAPYAHLEELGTGTVEPKQHDYEHLPVYHWQGQGHYQDAGTGEDIVKLRQDQQQQQFQGIEAVSNVRALLVGGAGAIFTLADHPQREMNQQVLVIGSSMFLKENASSTGDGDDHTDWGATLIVAPSKHQYRPQQVTPLPKIPGPQTAIVVGPPGQEIWTNDLGEIRVQFLWDRYAEGDEYSSCWVRVCSSWAGDGWGSEKLPRIGTEVIMSFLDGNPDYPIVMGRVVNSSKPPPSFSNTGSLPGNQALAGMKSRELQGSRYNQLLFDDTTGQIRTQLESEHGKTQLNMGYLVHPRDVSATPRGEGFELRTDAWGAVRAAKGLLISTDGRHAALGNALSREELINCLEVALDLAKNLDDCATTCLGNAADTQPQENLMKEVKEWGHGSNAEVDGKGGAPIFAVSAPSGIALVAQQSTTIASGLHVDLVARQNQHLTSGQKLNLHAGKGISHYAHEEGIKSIAHKGTHIVQAQSDDIEIAADQNVIITASEANVLIAAQEDVTLTSGKGYIKIANGNIDIHCPGTIDMKAGNFAQTGPTSMSVDLPSF